MVRFNTSTSFDAKQSTEYKCLSCGYWPCTCPSTATVTWYQWPPKDETNDEKAKRIVVNLIVKGDFFPKDREHLEKVIQLVKEGL